MQTSHEDRASELQLEPLVTLICPACERGPIRVSSAEDGNLACPSCDATWPIRRRVVELAGRAIGGPETLGQRQMEWVPMTRVYEGMLWRRNPLFAALLGLSFRREVQLILHGAQLAGDERVLDLCCGPGNYARRLARAVPEGSVVGLDVSTPMLDVASARAREEGPDRLVFLHADAMDPPLADGQFDVVNCCGAMHLLRPVEQALAQIFRVLRPGGRLTVACARHPVGAVADRLTARNERRYGVHYFETGELEAACGEAGFEPPRVHFAFRYWQVLSAVRPAA